MMIDLLAPFVLALGFAVAYGITWTLAKFSQWLTGRPDPYYHTRSAESPSDKQQ